MFSVENMVLAGLRIRAQDRFTAKQSHNLSPINTAEYTEPYLPEYTV
jgi:hypothetical protein